MKLPVRDLAHVLIHTASVWKHLEGARIFVTGGTGFFGCWLVETFAYACDQLHTNASMTVLSRSPEAFRAKVPHLAAHQAIHLIEGNVRSFAFPRDRFTHVIHGATSASAEVNRTQPLEMLDTIIDGTRRTLDFAVATGAQRFLLLSSGAVYDEALDPSAAYAEGKRVAELLCAIYSRAHSLACPIARCFAFVGPHLPLDAHFAIGNFVRDCLHARPIEIRGDGTPYRSYLYAADLAIWLWTILVHGASCQPYNTGSEHAVTIAELAAMVAAVIRPGTEIRIALAPRPDLPAERYVPDTGRTRKELGLREYIPLEDAIRRTAAWHRPVRLVPRLIPPRPFYGEAQA